MKNLSLMGFTDETIRAAKVIHLLESGRYKERSQYLKELHDTGSTLIDGFTIQAETYCWLIWKPTDESKNPEYKGEPLLKIVPRIHESLTALSKIIAAQAWHYI